MRYFLTAISFLFYANSFSQVNNTTTPFADGETDEESQAHITKLLALKAAYYANHKDAVPVQKASATHVLFGWPMRPSSDYDFQYNYFNLQNYVDQIRTPTNTSIEDYNCGDRTYDDHDASDINLWPFWWRMMDNNYIMAVAAAPGIIMEKIDGNFDHNCTKVGSSNQITLMHDDGSFTYYHHLKTNSLTAKDTMERVEQGEFLGYIGSSGHSSNPHLHFAVHDAFGRLIEPYFGATCNNYGTETWWQNERQYWEPQINRLMTHSAVPDPTNFCPDEEVVNAKNQFSSGDVLVTGIAFMDGQIFDAASCSLYQPDGNVFASWTESISLSSSRTYKTHSVLLPFGNTGTWTFRATYRGKIYAHFFTVGCKAFETPSGTIIGNDGYITGSFISSTAIHTGSSNTKVLYQAANYIELKPGFQASAGIHFKARIKPCTFTE
ncbi:MAG: M23 family metallopeptidase [Ferruginibacter sp.]